MKQLKSRVQDLRRLFESSITIEAIAEPLQSIPAELDAIDAMHWIATHDFDVAGVEHHGIVSGYVERSALAAATSGTCGDYQRVFHPSELVAVSMPLMKLLPLLQQTPRLFVLDGNQISGILTCGDLQKAPVRMLLFGLVTLLEMHLLRIVRLAYPDESWQTALKSDRLQTAQRLWKERQVRNEATELLDYLQFCDKRDLILRRPDLMQQLGLPSKRGGDRLLTAVEQLRNRLAHAQDLVSGSSWAELIELANAMEALLRRCESIE